ncbi:unnamed protein product [Cyclocybe aegerita]|uniref:Uncharacterized protein n=1 Tax=Cyclocybe aegerita TaxID=1973307 RepID=A0A8S0W192_CYCAE|nr:unnamed protein product [Cyclocybe aegerita]
MNRNDFATGFFAVTTLLHDLTNRYGGYPSLIDPTFRPKDPALSQVLRALSVVMTRGNEIVATAAKLFMNKQTLELQFLICSNVPDEEDKGYHPTHLDFSILDSLEAHARPLLFTSTDVSSEVCCGTTCRMSTIPPELRQSSVICFMRCIPVPPPQTGLVQP